MVPIGLYFKSSNFCFNTKTSQSAIKDEQFLNRLFKQALISSTAPNNNNNNDLICHCYNMFQTLDMPDKLKYIQYLYQQQHYIPFLDQLYQLPNGIKYLIDIRFSLLKMLKQYPNEYQLIEQVEIILRDKLKNWVTDTSMIQQITWQSSSAETIEKICQYEAVHAVQDINDIKRRLGPDRRVFALFSKTSLTEPLVFIHVALVPELATSIQTILHSPIPYDDDHRPLLKKRQKQPVETTTMTSNFKYAICYSITTQQGLGGINLGNHLIKQVIHQLQQSYPTIHTFATLSPIPGFRHWLLTQTNLVDQLCDIGGFHWENLIPKITIDHPLKSKLLEFCARYILKEKRESNDALDPVANFHLRNGACVHKLHWLGDTSIKGLNESFGIMVNYKYIPSSMTYHHQLYVKDNIIMLSEKTLSCLSDYVDDVHVLKLKNIN